MAELKRVRITGDADGTHVIDVETGREFQTISVDWHSEVNSIAVATVKVLFTEVDVETGAKVVTVCPECRGEPGAYNVNDEVKLRLNDRGRALYRRHHAEPWVAGHPVEPEVDADGFTRMPLWECMAIFGQHLGARNDMPFEAAIVLDRRS